MASTGRKGSSNVGSAGHSSASHRGGAGRLSAGHKGKVSHPNAGHGGGGGRLSTSNLGSPSRLSTDSSPQASVLVTRVAFIAVVVLLLLFGLVMLYSASSVYSYNHYGDAAAIFSKQLIFVVAGVVITLVVALVSYRLYTFTFALAALAVTIPLLVLVLTQGNDALGARRWIDLGFVTLQPSEFTKIAVMLVMIHLVSRCREQGTNVLRVAVMTLSCVVPLLLIMVEPDLGTTIICVFGILAVLWFGGMPKRIVGIMTLGLFVLGALAIFGTGFRQARITSWLAPESDPLGTGYQLMNSYYAFGEGGLFGVGIGLSRQKFNWLPQSENDFLFAIVGEELGFFGALLVVLLFLALLFLALRIARSAPDANGAMIAGASGVILASQAFLNMLCVVGALPTTGKPLPFFSAGGSSIISTLLLVGLILSVSLRSRQANIYEFRREQFTVVSSEGRSRGTVVPSRARLLSFPPAPAARPVVIPASTPATRPAARPAATLAARPAVRPAATRITSASAKAAPSTKIVPISRGRAAQQTAAKAALRTTKSGTRQPVGGQQAQTSRERTGGQQTGGLRAGQQTGGLRAGSQVGRIQPAAKTQQAAPSLSTLKRNRVRRNTRAAS